MNAKPFQVRAYASISLLVRNENESEIPAAMKMDHFSAPPNNNQKHVDCCANEVHITEYN